MILFTILFIILVVLAILTVLGVAALGAAGIVVFGDVIVCVVIIALIIRHFIKKRQQSRSGVSNGSCFSRILQLL